QVPQSIAAEPCDDLEGPLSQNGVADVMTFPVDLPSTDAEWDAWLAWAQ
ncbi:hypothetical protein ACEPAI_6613, partial [Sanghuangporus weigelae]